MRTLAIGLAVSAVVAAAAHAEEKFTSADVLRWEQSQQAGYFETSTMMAAIVASKNDSPAAGCIDAWYFAQPAAQTEIVAEFRHLLTKYPDYHPGLVVSAMIERECGSLKFTD